MKADFMVPNAMICSAPATLNFVNTSAGPGPLAYNWTFGDGNTGADENPTHNYLATGTYSVTLIAVSPQGCTDTVQKNNLVNIGNFAVNFSGPDSICVDETVSFNNTSLPSPTASVWDFGNGVTSVLFHPSITYAAAGTYTIKLISDFGGCLDSTTKKIYVSAKPQPQFTASQKTFCTTPATVNFTNQTPGSGSVVWDFGDGATSTQNNPSHTYTTPGNYTVSLTATNVAGCSETITQTDFIQIQKPQVTLNGLPRSGCAPVTINPTATVLSNHTITSYAWTFGDGTSSTAATPTHTYSASGTYAIKLVYTT
ncbi:MAG: PKD domain-containing protein, partial [Chitinophagaceae bacterium]